MRWLTSRSPTAQEEAAATIKSYYAWLGPYADQIAAGAATTPEMVKGYIAGFEQSGCDELIFAPGSSRLDQVALLADAKA